MEEKSVSLEGNSQLTLFVPNVALLTLFVPNVTLLMLFVLNVAVAEHLAGVYGEMRVQGRVGVVRGHH